MKLVAVSIVKNEADIIEAFVRHTAAWVDHHLVFDHDSTDGTREILGALQGEGLPLTLFTDDSLGHVQQARSNHLVRLAATQLAADWILPLDGDEILAGPGRAALETHLAELAVDQPASHFLVNYQATTADDPAMTNPVLRLRYHEAAPPRTVKILLPRALALDPTVTSGKGSHTACRGETVLPAQPLPETFYLAHFAMRSPGQQALRVTRAELQKLSQGRANAGLDQHYRLGFQLLAENPELFFATTGVAPDQLRERPVTYRGDPLRYTSSASEWVRIGRALLPYLEKLAASHGALLDARPVDTLAPSVTPVRELTDEDLPRPSFMGTPGAFAGFTAVAGWGDLEGPVPTAFLPRFRWAHAPQTQLIVNADHARTAVLSAEALTYSEDQAVTLLLNGTELRRFPFARVNEKLPLQLTLPLRAGPNDLTLRYDRFLQTEYDPRQLAVIFLSLRID